jgi:sucrose-6-phosphate hydrolase SacC (GH32 family)
MIFQTQQILLEREVTETGLTNGSVCGRLAAMNADHLRPALHFTPPRNWMNDPCGLVYHEGVYHLFYQHNPGANEWGDIHWGHAISRDLLHWRDRPPAIAPDASRGMPYTGSCVVTPDGEIAALFTGALPGALPGKPGTGSLQQQCLATTRDGEVWRHEGVVIANPGRADFRDPKVGRHPGTGEWYLVLAAGDEVIFYSSRDLRSWRRESTFGRGMGYNAGEWECPDLFRLPRPGPGPESDQDVWVLVVHEGRGLSPRLAGAQYILGTFDGRRFSPIDGDFRPVDGGHDFYAAQTWSNTPDRTVWIAWAAHWAHADTPTASEWSGILTLPREVSLVADATALSGLRLCQQPVREIATLETMPLTAAAAPGDSALGTNTTSRVFHPAPSAPVRVRISTPVGGALPRHTRVVFSFDGGADLRVTWTGHDLIVDRKECLPGGVGAGTSSPEDRDAYKAWPVATTPEGAPASGETAAAAPGLGPALGLGLGPAPGPEPGPGIELGLELELFLDRSILEVFAAGGRAVITDLVFPPGPLISVSVDAPGEASLEVSQLPETMSRS